MAQRYGPFTPTFNEHRINEELARLNIADNNAPTPSKEEMFRGFSTFYKVRSLISEQLNAVKGEDALALFYNSYTKRSVQINPGKDWETKEVVMTKLTYNTNVTIVLPPFPPPLCDSWQVPRQKPGRRQLRVLGQREGQVPLHKDGTRHPARRTAILVRDMGCNAPRHFIQSLVRQV